MSLLDVTKEQIEQFLSDNFRKLKFPEYMYGVDNNQDTYQDFENAKLRILVVFNSPGETRAISNTFNVLSWLCHRTLGKDVFVDNCYYPEEVNHEFFFKNNIPFIFGNVSHHPASAYDLIFLSVNIIPEVLNIPHMLKNSGFGLTIEQREKQNIPPIILGGAGASETAIILGHIADKEGNDLGKSLVDMALYGFGEEFIPELVTKTLEYKGQGNSTHDKAKFTNWLLDNQVLHTKLFFPKYYEWVYDDKGQKIEEIKTLDPRVPKRVDFSRMTNNKFEGFPLKTFHLSDDHASSVDIQVAQGCSGASSVCSFCQEGTVAGSYWERPLEDVEDNMRFTRKTSAANVISYYSYNSNYYSRFMDLIFTGSKYFPQVSLHNERMDVIANVPEQLELSRRVGLRRMASPIEGIGERIRNQIFNKNLHRDTLMQAMRNLFKMRLMHIKIGLILSGLETEEDIDDFISELDEILKIRDEEGATSYIQLNCTPLVLYSQIALRYLPRRTAEISFNSERNMGKLIDYARSHNMRIKFHGKGAGTWMEQLILDFGPMGTQSLIDITLGSNVSYYGAFNDKDKQAWLDSLARRGYDPLWFTFARPYDWIFPSDHIQYVTEEVKQMWIERTKKMNFDTPICLKTPAQLSPKCYGCKTCPPEHIKYMLTRELKDQHTLDQVVEALSDSRNVYTTRVVVQQSLDWYFYGRTALSHYITSRLFVECDKLADAFYSVGKNSLSWVSNQGQKCWYRGVWAFDINWNRRVSQDLLEGLIEKVNSKLKVAQIVRIIPDTKALKIDRNTELSFMGTSSVWGVSQITDKLSVFDWDIKVAQKSMGSTIDLGNEHHPEIKSKFLMVPYKGQTLVYMTVPSHINPYLVMSSIIGKGYDKMLQDWDFRLMDMVKDVDASCRCGNHLTYSYFTGKYNKFCPVCHGKMLLATLTR